MKNKQIEVRTITVTVIKGSVGNTEWWTQKDWDKHNKFVEECKLDGTYGQAIECNISFIPDPTFDDPIAIKGNIGDYRMEFIDLNNEG